jgi:hypothetical protein
MQEYFVVRLHHEERELLVARWGLVNRWAKDNSQAARLRHFRSPVDGAVEHHLSGLSGSEAEKNGAGNCRKHANKAIHFLVCCGAYLFIRQL